MSNALAIAAVTAILRDLLDSGMIDHEVTDAVGQGVTVTAAPPDTIPLEGSAAKPQINLFLHQVAHNGAMRNLDLPSRGQDGMRLRNAPLALDLHYLVTAYGTGDLQSEVLLGYAMQLLHETPIPSRTAIRAALRQPGAPVDGALLPSAYQALRASDLAEQVEQIKITPVPMASEEMSKLWSALQAHYRPTAAYLVTVVLIQAARPAAAALPVLTRGERIPTAVDPNVQRESGALLRPDILSGVPTIDAVTLPQQRLAAHLGDHIVLTGSGLDGSGHALQLSLPRLGIEQVVDPALGADASAIHFELPSAVSSLVAGNYLVSVRLQRQGEPGPRSSGQLALALAPEFTASSTPLTTVGRDAEGTAELVLGCRPRVLAEQRASLLLGGREIFAEPRSVPSDDLTFLVTDAPPGEHRVRLRIDGVDSVIVDRTKSPPEYLNHKVVIQ